MLSVILGVLIFTSSGLASEDFDYNHQDAWGGNCNDNDNHQSPINVLTYKVECDSKLPGLLYSGWGTGYSGVFENTGHNVQFNPYVPDQAKTYSHRGIYLLKQFHMHWGRRADEGSEHLVNGKASEVEIHFVHVKQGGKPTDKDYYAVVGVMADVALLPISGPWAKLNAAAVQSYESSIHVSGIRFDQLLPARRDYYYYQGSLTTPPCTEAVAWFLLKDRIKVPYAYLEKLRKVQGAGGHTLNYNFRKPQSLGFRKVKSPCYTS